MFYTDFRAIALFIMSSIAWYFGAIELYYVITDFSNQWYWLLLIVCYFMIVIDCFFHLSVGHYLYPLDPSRWGYKVFVFLTVTNLTLGSIIGMAQFHGSHHVYADQDDYDHLSAKLRWMTAGFLSPLMFIWQPKPLLEPPNGSYKSSIHKNIENDPWTLFCDRNQVWITLSLWIVLYFTVPVILFKFLFMGRLVLSISHLLSSIGGHYKLLVGYRNFDTKDNSYNNLILHYMYLGLCPSFLHNNHHGKNFAKTHSEKWYEIDLGSKIINYVLKPLISYKK